MIHCLIFLSLVQYITGSAYISVDYKNKTQVDIFNKYKQAVCGRREEFCKKEKKSTLCTVRKNNVTNKMEYKDFHDSCRLFIYNFCDYPGQEYYIVSAGTCKSYLNSRRSEDNLPNEDSPPAEDSPPTEDSPPEDDNANQGNTTDTPETETQPVEETTPGYVYIPKSNKQILRQQLSTKQTIKRYGIESAEDGHPCPYHCTNTYDPQCMNVNVGAGLYFNYKIFINHCQLDMFYCKNYDNEKYFPMPPDEEDWSVQSSKLSFSACADVRYMQFARFSETTSSLGHYGWLPDKQRYYHIMNPQERRPGFG